MQVELPDVETWAPVEIRFERPMDDDEYHAFCAIADGVSFARLIDADQRTVYIYRPDKEPEQFTGVDHVDGEGPVAGFRLELTDIWQGL
ncbi:MAG TPA: hypothetical protein VMH28_09160 [Candidatus Acidoferrales bacterium]|nr:hypothetical protein [Candidatus Acidoferrales bacterium]